MANERKDDLFDVTLGGGLIEIPDKGDEVSDTTGKETKKEEKKGPVKIEENVLLHQDGSFEIDEFAEEKKKNIENPSEDDDEEEGAIIEKTEKKKETPSKGGSSDSSPSSSPYLAFAKDRASEGVFLNFTDEDWADLVERNEGDEAQALRELHSLSLQKIVQKNVEKYKESLTPEEKMLYEAKEKGLPLDRYSVAKHNHTKYSKITAEQIKSDPKIAEDVVAKFLELKGFTPEEAKEEIEGYKALDNLEPKAIKALEVVPKAFEKQIKDIEVETESAEKAKTDKIRQRVARMKSMVDNVPEIIPGIKLTKPVREKIMESMTVPVSQDEDGNPLNPVMATRQKNPEGFEMLIHYYHQLGLFNIDDSGKLAPDFSKIAKIEKTKAVDSMRSAFESKENSQTGKAAKPKTQDDDMTDWERAFKRL